MNRTGMGHGATPNNTGNRIVLAHSGGVTTSVAIPWLADRLRAEVITVTLDLGQARELAVVREQALALGAVRAHVIDAREEFVRDFVEPGLRAGLFTDGGLDRTVQIARPLIARRLAELARMESAPAVAFGGRDATALAGAVVALAPALRVISLLHDEDFARNDLSSLARQYNVQVPSRSDHHADATLWGRVVTLADAAEPEDAFTLTRAAVETPSTAAVVEIDFEAGVPVRTNGVEMSLAEMIESLETIAGAHGVGRDLTAPEHLAVEAPAALVLQTAHQALAASALGGDLTALTAKLGRLAADLLSSGRWFSDVREGIDGFIDVLRPRLSGRVRLELLRAAITVRDVTLHAPAANTKPRAVA